MNNSGASLATLKALVEAFNAHDLDRIMSFFAEDAVLEMPRGPDPWGYRHVGAAAVREGLRSRFEGLPDVHYGDDSHYPLCRRRHGHFAMDRHWNHPERREHRRPRMRLLQLLRRQGGEEGFLLEDGREGLMPWADAPFSTLKRQPQGPRRLDCGAEAHGPFGDMAGAMP